jgi:long-chain fatty acid transport protein
MRRSAVLCAVSALALTIRAPSARAQGFSVYEHDACAMARAGAGVASPCNSASAIFFNPAGILGGPKAKAWNLQAGATLIHPIGSFTDSATRAVSSLKNETFIVPSGYLTHQFGPRVAAGIGVFAPYGLTTSWDPTFLGRYLGYKTTLASLYFQPTVALEVVPGLQLGVGVDYVHSTAQVHRRLDASAQTETVSGTTITLGMLGVPPGTDFADVLFDVSGNGWGGHAGVLWKATDRLSVGARYLSQVKVNFSGTATFTPVLTGITLAAGNPFGAPAGTTLEQALFAGAGALLGKQDASTKITMPEQLVVGVAFKVVPTLNLMADWQWTNWKAFKTLDLHLSASDTTLSEYEHYGATNALRAGFDWQATPAVAIRGGVLTHNGASPEETVTPILPEGQRFEGTVGAGIHLMPNLRLDLAYQYIRQQDRRGRMTDPVGRDPLPLDNTGLFKFTANLFGASLALAF